MNPSENPASTMIPRPQLRRRGTTLIEVLLGLVLLATLISSAMVARGRFLRQWSDAQRKLKLADAADQLMPQLTSATPAQLVGAGGPIATVPGGSWRTTLIADSVATSMEATKVRLTVDDGRSPPANVIIEFLVHSPPPTTRPHQQSGQQPGQPS